MADDGHAGPEAGMPEDGEAAFRRVLSRRLAGRGLSGPDLEREVERLFNKAETMRLVDEGRMSRRP